MLILLIIVVFVFVNVVRIHKEVRDYAVRNEEFQMARATKAAREERDDRQKYPIFYAEMDSRIMQADAHVRYEEYEAAERAGDHDKARAIWNREEQYRVR